MINVGVLLLQEESPQLDWDGGRVGEEKPCVLGCPE